MREVIAAPVDAQAFDPFGVLLSDAGIRATHRHGAPGSATCIETLLAPVPPHAGYCDIELLENHALSTQTFFPLDVSRYLVVACPGDEEGRPDIALVRAFIVGGNMAVQYHQGIWHCNMAALDRPGLFVNLVQKNHSADDCTFITVPPFRVTLPG